jgi:hypothetical protein
MYTTNSDHKTHISNILNIKDCRGRATDSFIQARWQDDDVAQGATIGEFAPNISIAADPDGNEMGHGNYTEACGTGSTDLANKNAARSRILRDHR